MSDAKVCVVVGVGPGLGGASALAFSNAGFAVASVARSEERVQRWAGKTGGKGYTADATDESSIRRVLQRIADEMGPIHTLVWNVGSGTFGNLDQVGPEALDRGFQTNARSLFVAVQEVVGPMRDSGQGNILITGATASRRGKPFTTAFAAGKAAQRSLAQSLARQLWPQGIHVALVVVDGMVDIPSSRARMPNAPTNAFIAPAAYGDTLLFLAGQDRTAWTFELEVRPAIENW